MALNLKATLQAALRQLESERATVDRQIQVVRSAIEGAAAVVPVQGRQRRRRMSAAARKAVGKRMKAYWAKRRAQKAAGGGSSRVGKPSTARKRARRARRPVKGTKTGTKK